MEHATVTFGIIGVLVVAAVIAYWFFKNKHNQFGGFRDWVANPDYKQAAADYFAARDSLDVPDDISANEIQQMVDRLFVQEDDDFNFDRLTLVGEKAVPLLVEAIKAPKTASTKFGDGGHALDANSPFERIVNLLEPIGPTDAAGPLSRFVDHEDDHFRKHAAIALGNIGNSECITPMLTALNDDDDYVRAYAMMGIERGMEANRCTEEFLNSVFPGLTKLLNREDDSVSGTAPELMLAIDPALAIAVLLSPEYFSIENKEVHYIIRALNAAGHKIPHRTLLPFLRSAKPLVDKYPHDYDYAAALMAYAHNPDDDAEEVFRAESKSSNEKVQKAAAEALAVLSGIANARDIVFEALDSHGFPQLSQSLQYYYAVLIYDAEVTNGGHSQYFVNSSGDHWKSAIEGLKAIGAGARATILHDATALFGADRPSENNERRHRQLSRFSKRQHRSLDDLDSRYYSCDENVQVLLAQYAFTNKEHFTAQK